MPTRTPSSHPARLPLALCDPVGSSAWARRSLLDGVPDISAVRRPADRGVRGRRQSLTVMLRPARPKRPARPHSRLSSMLSPSLVIGQDHGRTRRRQPVRYHEHQPKGEPETSNDSLHRTASLWWVTENPLLCDATPRTPIPNSHGTAPREDPGVPTSGHWAPGFARPQPPARCGPVGGISPPRGVVRIDSALSVATFVPVAPVPGTRRAGRRGHRHGLAGRCCGLSADQPRTRPNRAPGRRRLNHALTLRSTESPRWDSNPRPPLYKSGALDQLSYSGEPV